MPQFPLHSRCHCEIKDILPPVAGETAFAKSTESKFSGYVLHPDDKKNKGKKYLFDSLGYDIMNIWDLIAAYTKQGLEQYVEGEYKLGNLDDYGQKIITWTTLESKFGEESKIFKTVWMTYPDGVIQLITPFGGFLT